MECCAKNIQDEEPDEAPAFLLGIAAIFFSLSLSESEESLSESELELEEESESEVTGAEEPVSVSCSVSCYQSIPVAGFEVELV